MSTPGTTPHDLCGDATWASPTEARGFAFADQLYTLVRTHGPAELSPTLQDAFSAYLLEAAIEWVKAHNRITKGRS